MPIPSTIADIKTELAEMYETARARRSALVQANILGAYSAALAAEATVAASENTVAMAADVHEMALDVVKHPVEP